MPDDNFYSEIGRSLNSRYTKDEFSRLKIRLCGKYRMKRIPTDPEIHMRLGTRPESNLVTKPSRTGSGVAVVAIMTEPRRCPHGRCIICPGGPDSIFGDVPQSYTGHEPASMRAKRNLYDAYLQVFNRLEQYLILGHSIGKIELILMGGTFPAYPLRYQKIFVRDAFRAMNDFSSLFIRNGFNMGKFSGFFELPSLPDNPDRTERIKSRILKSKKKSGKALLDKEQRKNEKSNARCVALCIETRPDYCRKTHINRMLDMGCTRVELGVQSLSDRILKLIERGHSVGDTIKATRLLRDSFLKTGYHVIPGLPGSSVESDMEMMGELFENPDYRPDALKIYPCIVVRGTRLYELWKKGKYKPLTVEEAAELIIKAKSHVPEYCRIMRVQRDIPEKLVEAGPKMTNLRQHIHRMMKTGNIKCRCIRCREPREHGKAELDMAEIRFRTEEYEASSGTEFFISAEDRSGEVLWGYCRLRIPFKPFRPEIKNGTVGIRELHIFGSPAEFGSRGEVQHRGLGRRLMEMSEEIGFEQMNAKRILVISGIGAREYYRRQGYYKLGAYMAKSREDWRKK